jgi:pyruvate formate lyase activating enzyme
MLAPGQMSTCRVRTNIQGKLRTYGYANPCAVHVDPIEKKPLYHVTPGSRAFSIAIAGCNFRCKNCQNWSISQKSPRDTRNRYMPPKQVVRTALDKGCTSIAYTYSEPTVWYEYMYDTAKLAKKKGLMNVLITCGYSNDEPLHTLAPYLDAANIDLKSFDPQVYTKLNAGQRDPILHTIERAKELGIWVELTNLIIPEWTDELSTIQDMCAWIRTHTDADTPLHFSRFYPAYKLQNLPPTPQRLLQKAKEIAVAQGLHYVYLGNVAGADSNTYCPECGTPVIERRGYVVTAVHIDHGSCAHCGHTIRGRWQRS